VGRRRGRALGAQERIVEKRSATESVGSAADDGHVTVEVQRRFPPTAAVPARAVRQKRIREAAYGHCTDGGEGDGNHCRCRAHDRWLKVRPRGDGHGRVR
jgi:hypothetical protein